jgi:hypothetical protein
VLNDPNDFDLKDWIMRNIYPDDPMERRRNELRSSAEASGFANDDLRNLGEPDFWELHFDRGTNAECTTAAEAEGWAVTSLADVDASSNRGSSWLF